MTPEIESAVPEVLLPGLRLEGVRRSGRVREAKGLILRSSLPEAHLGELVRIERDGEDLAAEVIGFDRHGALLMPFSRLEDVAAESRVIPEESQPTIPAGDAVLGRVLDALGQPLDGRGPLWGAEFAPLQTEPPPSLERRPITEPIVTGRRALDGLLTLGRGQRVSICAAAGAGKSTLLGQLLRHIEADRIVLALIGERGREVRQFLDHDLDGEARRRATVVVSTSDQSPLLRMRAAYAATAIAESARARGENVVLMMDSVTRFARALRDVGQALGEPIGKGGLPASLFLRLPQLFERAGNDAHGTLTAFYTVLAEDDALDDPIVEETISLLDGHILLSRKIAQRKRFPAVSILSSVSRLMAAVTGAEHQALAQKAAELEAEHAANLDKIKMGLYETGNLDSEQIEERHQSLEEFLAQGPEPSGFDETLEAMSQRFGGW